MKNSCRIFIFIVLFFGFIFSFNSCKKDVIPSLTTGAVSNITENSATFSANISDDGGSDISIRGFVWHTSANPSIESNLGFSENGTESGDFTYNIENLDDETTYFVRAYATNELGTAYGNEVSFTTNERPWNGTPCTDCETVTDIDGNVYRTASIGAQCWLVENLRTTKYNDGNQIPIITDNIEWKNSTSGAMCYYDNESDNEEDYGILYNFYAVETDKLCPEGWHVATDNEWKEMEGYVDSEYGIGNSVWDSEGWRGIDAGIKLKTNYDWLCSPDETGTDDFGFSGLPAGLREGSNGEFQRINEWGLWWSDKNADEINVYRRYLGSHENNIARFPSNPANGHSVRCIKN
ncbi:MAG: fibrobacter succinogenes major paralogous domain-containing protein [Bacteroidales bacterium]|nr:fibrobacter succinogenes major paralogous domain-containing protein [Bacteroidales bacterium]